jgi:exportin-2 (importin alpha re-exporter)
MVVQIPKAACLSLFPHLVALLLDEHNVVHSYAAHCIERLLVVRDAGKPRFTAQVRWLVREGLSREVL